MKGIILAGGYAKRLWPLTQEKPKHLLPINGKPMIEHLLEKMQTLDIEQYYLVTNDKFAHMFEEWVKDSAWANDLIIINDNTKEDGERLGSLGDILYTIDTLNISDDLFIIGADNITDFDFQLLFDKYAETKSPVVGVYELGDKELAKQFGVVQIDEDGKMISFEEKPEEPKSTLISTLFYVLPRSTVPAIRSLVDEGKHDKAGELIHRLLEDFDVYTIKHSGYWFDIGTKETYQQAQDFFENQ